MEWERQRAYDFESGKEAGAEQKAVEDAVMLVKKYNASPEITAKDMNAPLELVLEALKKKDAQ